MTSNLMLKELGFEMVSSFFGTTTYLKKEDGKDCVLRFYRDSSKYTYNSIVDYRLLRAINKKMEEMRGI